MNSLILLILSIAYLGTFLALLLLVTFQGKKLAERILRESAETKQMKTGSEVKTEPVKTPLPDTVASPAPAQQTVSPQQVLTPPSSSPPVQTLQSTPVQQVIQTHVVQPALPTQASPQLMVSAEVEVPEPQIVDENIRRVALSLTQDEVRVLQFLIERGGEAYQMEIYKTLGIPKSTVTKIVRRLSERGILAVERRGRYNYVRVVNIDYARKLVREALASAG